MEQAGLIFAPGKRFRMYDEYIIELISNYPDDPELWTIRIINYEETGHRKDSRFNFYQDNFTPYRHFKLKRKVVNVL